MILRYKSTLGVTLQDWKYIDRLSSAADHCHQGCSIINDSVSQVASYPNKWHITLMYSNKSEKCNKFND